jgi:hypothetical protein
MLTCNDVFSRTGFSLSVFRSESHSETRQAEARPT